MKLEIKAIDIHSHYNHGSQYDTKTDDFYCCDIDFLLKKYENANIKCGAFSSFASVISDKDIIAENEHLYNLTKSNERIFQWVVIDPRQESTLIQADKILKSDKCLGIKIHPPGHGYDTRDYADKIFSFANERKTFVLIHIDFPFHDVAHEFANKYPDMKLIIAHLGGINVVNKAKYDNIFLDTSGSSSIKNNVIEYTVNKVGSEKVFFGTDTYDVGFQRGRIEYAGISDKDKENILYNNAKRHFPIFEF